MKSLWLSEEQARQLADHARSEVPHEACGLIAGHGDRVTRLIPIKNTAADPVHQYVMDQAELSRHLPALMREGLDLIGFYHSHPTGEPIPSPTDVAQAHYPDTAYLIIGLKHAEPHFAAWLINQGRVSRLPLGIGINPPVVEDESLSNAQKMAAIVSAVVAFILLLVLSLLLLPPAPIIPS